MASRFWIKMNESPRARRNRDEYVKENGGEFVKVRGKGWKWIPSSEKSPKTVVKSEPVKTEEKTEEKSKKKLKFFK